MSDELIEVVRGYDLLYNPKNKDYKDQSKRTEVWEEISIILKQPVEKCKEEWGKLRNAYSSALNRRKTKSGQAATQKASWKYEEQMNFLRPHMEMRKTQTNLKPPPTLDENSSDITPESPAPETAQSPPDFRSDSQLSSFSKVSQRSSSSLKRKPDVEDIYDLMKTQQVLRQQKQQPKLDLDETDMFFLSMSKSVKALSKLEQTKIKIDLHMAVHQAEISKITETEHTLKTPLKIKSQAIFVTLQDQPLRARSHCYKLPTETQVTNKAQYYKLPTETQVTNKAQYYKLPTETQAINKAQYYKLPTETQATDKTQYYDAPTDNYSPESQSILESQAQNKSHTIVPPSVQPFQPKTFDSSRAHCSKLPTETQVTNKAQYYKLPTETQATNKAQYYKLPTETQATDKTQYYDAPTETQAADKTQYYDAPTNNYSPESQSIFEPQAQNKSHTIVPPSVQPFQPKTFDSSRAHCSKLPTETQVTNKAQYYKLPTETQATNKAQYYKLPTETQATDKTQYYDAPTETQAADKTQYYDAPTNNYSPESQSIFEPQAQNSNEDNLFSYYKKVNLDLDLSD